MDEFPMEKAKKTIHLSEIDEFPMEKFEREKVVLEENLFLLIPEPEREQDRSRSFEQNILDEVRIRGAAYCMSPTEVCLAVSGVLLSLFREAFPEKALQEVFKSDLLEEVRVGALAKGREEGRQQLLDEQERTGGVKRKNPDKDLSRPEKL